MIQDDATAERKRPRDPNPAENPKLFCCARRGRETTIVSVVAPWWGYLSSYTRLYCKIGRGLRPQVDACI